MARRPPKNEVLMNRFLDRPQAGRALAELLKQYAHQPDVIVLALPRGGVPVAYEIAQALSAPLDVIIVRKLGVPGHEEFAFGAVASGGSVVFNEDIMSLLALNQSAIDQVLKDELQEMARREQVYRGDSPFPELTDKTVILVDDGIATGATMRAAIQALQQKKPAKIIIAVPVAAHSTCEAMAAMVNQIVCPLQPVDLNAVGLWYDNFSQTSDSEVIELLAK